MKISCSGIILAGGLGSRFSGLNKAFLRIGQKRIIDHIYDVFKDIFTEIIIVTNNPLAYVEWDVTIVTDIFPHRSSLTGIHTGLFYATRPYAFFSACDVPFIKRELVQTLVSALRPPYDIVIPETSTGLEPLCAVYSKRCIKPIESHLLQKEFKIQRFFNKVRVKKIAEQTLREADPELISFFNINTPPHLTQAQKKSRL